MKRVHCAPAQTLQIITSKYKKDGYNRNIAFGGKGWFLLLSFWSSPFFPFPIPITHSGLLEGNRDTWRAATLAFPQKKEAKMILMPFFQINIFSLSYSLEHVICNEHPKINYTKSSPDFSLSRLSWLRAHQYYYISAKNHFAGISGSSPALEFQGGANDRWTISAVGKGGGSYSDALSPPRRGGRKRQDNILAHTETSFFSPETDRYILHFFSGATFNKSFLLEIQWRK